jgi:hypothetical protein
MGPLRLWPGEAGSAALAGFEFAALFYPFALSLSKGFSRFPHV